MKTLNLIAWGSIHPITFNIKEYANKASMYVGMITNEEVYPEPWSDLTVNVGVKCAENCAFIDTNNNGFGIIDWLISNNLGELTGREKLSGFCVFPEFRFNMEELRKYEDGNDEMLDDLHLEQIEQM